MTINIPLKAVAFVLYTMALLGGAFGISYAVFEWRDDDATSVTDSAPVQTGPTQAELDARKCEAALGAAGDYATTDVGSAFLSRGLGYPAEIQTQIDRYCK